MPQQVNVENQIAHDFVSPDRLCAQVQRTYRRNAERRRAIGREHDWCAVAVVAAKRAVLSFRHVASSASHMGGANEMQCMTTDAPENQGQMAWALDQPTFAQPDQGYWTLTDQTTRPVRAREACCSRRYAPRCALCARPRGRRCGALVSTGKARGRPRRENDRHTASGCSRAQH